MQLSNVIIKMNKDGYHRKLQEFVFDNPPLFSNLCPYFWFTVLSAVCFPFVLSAKGIVGLYRIAAFGTIKAGNFALDYIFAPIGNIINYVLDAFFTAFVKVLDLDRKYGATYAVKKVVKKKKDREFRDTVLKFTLDGILDMYLDITSACDDLIFYDFRYYRNLDNLSRMTELQWESYENLLLENIKENPDRLKREEYKKHFALCKKHRAWRTVDPDWKEKQSQLTEKFSERERFREEQRLLRAKEEREREEACRKRRAKFTKAIMWTEKLVKPICWGCLLVVSFLFGFGVQQMVALVWDDYILQWLIPASVIAGISIIYFWKLFVVLLNTSFARKPVYYTKKGFTYVYVNTPLKLLVDYIKAFKANQCPQIDWE